MKEHTCKAKHMHKRTHSYISADLCECEFYQMSNVYETGWYSTSSFDALLTQTDTCARAFLQRDSVMIGNGTKTKNHLELRILIDHSLKLINVRLLPIYFFSPSIFTTISSTVTATHVVAVIGAVAAVGLPCRALLFHIFLLLFSACKYMYVFREITFQAHVRKMTTAAARPKQQASK